MHRQLRARLCLRRLDDRRHAGRVRYEDETSALRVVVLRIAVRQAHTGKCLTCLVPRPGLTVGPDGPGSGVRQRWHRGDETKRQEASGMATSHWTASRASY